MFLLNIYAPVFLLKIFYENVQMLVLKSECSPTAQCNQYKMCLVWLSVYYRELLDNFKGKKARLKSEKNKKLLFSFLLKSISRP